MKKAELLSLGVPEEKIHLFQEAYWADVRKQAIRMAEESKGHESALSLSSMREAIFAMVRLIPDPDRLSLILSNVNRHYQTYRNEQDSNGKRPETDQKGASECL